MYEYDLFQQQHQSLLPPSAKMNNSSYTSDTNIINNQKNFFSYINHPPLNYENNIPAVHCNSSLSSSQWRNCFKCHQALTSAEETANILDQFYHSFCLTCNACGKLVSKSDSFGIYGNLLFCPLHYKLHVAVQSALTTDDVKENRATSGNHFRKQDKDDKNPAADFVPMTQKRRHCKRKRSSTGGAACSSPPKRVRTAFESYQLKMLNEFFISCSKPTKEHLEKLEKMTGLNARILRVWFQNARAKLRQKTTSAVNESSNDCISQIHLTNIS